MHSPDFATDDKTGDLRRLRRVRMLTATILTVASCATVLQVVAAVLG